MWAVKLIAWLLGLFFFLVLIVLPLLTAILINNGLLTEGFSGYLAAIEKIQVWAMQCFTIAWFFFVGSCFASFLNVVAWRVPRGRSILGSSHCPRCQTRLAFTDNLPIVGWLFNVGRCRTCQSPISPRYLIAELVLGSIVLLFALIELAGGGWNLPFRPLNRLLGFENLLFDPQWDLIRILSYHLVLLSALFTFTLIEVERFRIPVGVIWFPLLVGLLVPMIWPDALFVSWNGQFAAETLTPFGIDTAATLLLGACSGLVIGWWWPFLFEHPTKRQGQNAAVGMMLVGVFLGWQAVSATAAIAILILGIELAIYKFGSVANGRTPRRLGFGNISSRIFLATIVQLLTWGLQFDVVKW